MKVGKWEVVALFRGCLTCSLQSSDIGDDCPAIVDRNVVAIATHEAFALGDRFKHFAVWIIGLREIHEARNSRDSNHSHDTLAVSGFTVTGHARNNVALFTVTEETSTVLIGQPELGRHSVTLSVSHLAGVKVANAVTKTMIMTKSLDYT